MKRFSSWGVAGRFLPSRRSCTPLVASVALSNLLCASAIVATTSYSNAGPYVYTVPNGVYQLQVEVIGAGGGGGGYDSHTPGNGDMAPT